MTKHILYVCICWFSTLSVNKFLFRSTLVANYWIICVGMQVKCAATVFSFCIYVSYPPAVNCFTFDVPRITPLKAIIISCSTLNKPEQLNIIYHSPNGLNEIKKKKRKRQHPCSKRYLAARVISLLLHTIFDYSSTDLQPLMSHLPPAHYCSLSKIQMDWAVHCRQTTIYPYPHYLMMSIQVQ